jgi:hypothetical protein
MIKTLATLILIAGISCKTNTVKAPSDVKFNSKQIADLVDIYIAEIRKKGRSSMTFVCMKNADTASFILIDSYPDLSKTSLNGIAEIHDVKVFFVGDCLKTNLLTLSTSNTSKLDNEAKGLKSGAKESVIVMREPITWELYFKGDSLFNYVPFEVISKAYPSVFNKGVIE